jgi:hypothetical protein
MMTPDLVAAEYVGGYRIRVRFADGTAGEVNLEDELYGPVFEPLKEPGYFKQFAIHPELHTLTWPNGADFAPEFLFSAVRVAA